MAKTFSRRRFLAHTTVAAAAACAWEPLMALEEQAPQRTLESSLLPVRSGSLRDVARSRVAYQSSSADDDHTAHLVTDGSESTYWECKLPGEQWVAIDLGEALPIDRVTLHWGPSYAHTYRIEVSTDGPRPTQWTTVHSTTEGNGAVEQVILKSPPQDTSAW